MICFAHLVQVARAFFQFKKAGCGIVVISQGKPEVLTHFEQKNKLPFPIVGDPERQVYHAFGLNRVSFLTFLMPWVLWKYVVKVFTGTPVRMPYMSEDVTQLGGNFLLDQAGNVLWEYRSKNPTNRPSVEQMLKAAGVEPKAELAPAPHAG
ncbi:MAG: AhpC/TSA family protein [Fimbriiglobus sp.]|nr:AhpC/TSA family protein [Fimbriiglobus sp.]